MRALVTGATGFVGGALVERLRGEGATAVVLLRSDATTARWADAGIEAHVGGIEDPNAVATAARGCDVIFHCAGERSSHASATALSWVNVAGTENVVQAARHAKVPRVVHLSSADVTLTGDDRLGCKEDMALVDHPLGAMLRTQRLGEDLALQASTAATSIVAVRPGWMWGPGDRGHLPKLLDEARHGGIRLHGRGDVLFATCYVGNVVEALIAAAKASGVGGGAYHVTDAEAMTAREFFSRLSEALGLPPPRGGIYALDYALAWVREQLGREGDWRVDVARRGCACLLDCVRAARELGYEPRVSVDDGMAALAQWVRDEGGPEAVIRAARAPQGDADAAAYERAANAAEAAEVA